MKLDEIDWQGVGAWVGGVILLVAFVGFLLGGGDSAGWWGGMAP